MTIALLDASDDALPAERALALALSRAPQRVLVFGAATRAARRMVERELMRRDERYLDVAAAWILDGRSAAPRSEGEAPPSRASIPIPMLELAVAVSLEDLTPLASARRAIELVNGQLIMAAPTVGDITEEEFQNAAMWIAGGRNTPGLAAHKGKPILFPGDVSAGAGITLLEAGRAQARITRLDESGNAVETRAVSLGGSTRMQVQG